MNTTAAQAGARPRALNDIRWLRIALVGVGLAVIGLLMMGLTMLMTATTDGGPFRHASDYILTAAALPHGIGLFLLTFGFHRLQHGRDGRLGTIGIWVYGVCMAELVVQCVASLVVRSEVTWGPLYPMCAVGLMIGLALLAAGSWRVGLLPKWMLAAWPPLGLIGSFLGIGPFPLVFIAFLIALAVLLSRRVAAQTAG